MNKRLPIYVAGPIIVLGLMQQEHGFTCSTLYENSYFVKQPDFPQETISPEIPSLITCPDAASFTSSSIPITVDGIKFNL